MRAWKKGALIGGIYAEGLCPFFSPEKNLLKAWSILLPAFFAYAQMEMLMKAKSGFSFQL